MKTIKTIRITGSLVVAQNAPTIHLKKSKKKQFVSFCFSNKHHFVVCLRKQYEKSEEKKREI